VRHNIIWAFFMFFYLLKKALRRKIIFYFKGLTVLQIGKPGFKVKVLFILIFIPTCLKLIPALKKERGVVLNVPISLTGT